MRGELPPRHVRIDSVVAGSAADKAGVRAGDALVTIDGKKVETVEEAKAAIQAVANQQAGLASGKPCPLVVRRGAGEERMDAVGVPPLGVQLVQVDLTPGSTTRFPWEGKTSLADPVAAARARSLFEPRQRDENKVRLTVARDGTRPYVEWSAQLLRGSYLLSFPAGQGLRPTRYPFEVAREFPWDEACELPAEDDVPPSPPAAPPDTGPFWAYVPAGPYRASGDPEAQQNPKRDAAVIRLPEEKALQDLKAPRSPEGYYVARFEVTSSMYLAYLNDREWHTAAKAFERVPRQAQKATNDTAYWKADAKGVFSLSWREDWPVIAVSWYDSEDYCRWLTKQVGGTSWEFRLPSEDEWEKATRGPDGRYYPWGDSFDDTFCAMVNSRPGEQKQRQPEPFRLFPVDEGPCGVRDMGGGIYEWTRTESGGGQWRILKGGTWGAGAAYCRCAYRYVSSPEYVIETLGFRVCARRTP